MVKRMNAKYFALSIMAALLFSIAPVFALTTATTESQSDSGTEKSLAATLVYELSGLSKDVQIDANIRDSWGNSETTTLYLYDDETGELLATDSFQIGKNGDEDFGTFSAANHSLEKAVRRVKAVVGSTKGGSLVVIKDANVTYTYEDDPVKSWNWKNISSQSEGGTEGSLGVSLLYEVPHQDGGTKAIAVYGKYRDSWQSVGKRSKIDVYNDETGELLLSSGWVHINGYDNSADPTAYAEPLALYNYALPNSVRRIRVDMASERGGDYVDMFDVYASYVPLGNYSFSSNVTANQSNSGNGNRQITFNLDYNASAIIVRGLYRDSWQVNSYRSRVLVYNDETNELLGGSDWRKINGYDDGSNPKPYAEPIVVSNYNVGNIGKIRVEFQDEQNPAKNVYLDMFDVSVEYSSVAPQLIVPDVTQPLVMFTDPTPLNTSQSQSFIYINITTNETATSATLELARQNTLTPLDEPVNESMSGSETNFYLNKTSLTDGNYTFKVYATDASGNTGVSEERFAVIDTIPPAAVTDLNKSFILPASIAWNWTIPSASDFNHIEVWLNRTFRENITSNSVTISGLSPSTLYEIQLRPVDNVGNLGTWTNDTAQTLAGGAPPSNPSGGGGGGGGGGSGSGIITPPAEEKETEKLNIVTAGEGKLISEGVADLIKGKEAQAEAKAETAPPSGGPTGLLILGLNRSQFAGLVGALLIASLLAFYRREVLAQKVRGFLKKKGEKQMHKEGSSENKQEQTQSSTSS